MNMYDYKDGYDIPDELLEKYYWKTSEGKFIKVDDLDDSHIINIVMLFGKQKLETTGYKTIVNKFNKIREERGF